MSQAPVVIGGMGGSGTRVYHTFGEVAGYSMGSRNHPGSRDSLPLHRWFLLWGGPYLRGQVRGPLRWAMGRHLKLLLRIANPEQQAPWGFKDPRTLYVLPFLDQLFPGMKYIHVVRDGRDHAFNPKFPYRVFERCLLSPEETRLADPCRKALHWARLNRMAETYGEEHMPGRYLVSRLEDLCADPEAEAARILKFLGVEDPAAVARAIDAVHVPSTLGRWRREPREAGEQVERTILPDLEHYGYALASTGG